MDSCVIDERQPSAGPEEFKGMGKSTGAAGARDGKYRKVCQGGRHFPEETVAELSKKLRAGLQALILLK